VDGTFDSKKRKRAYLRAVGPDEGAPAHLDPDVWTGSSIRSFDSNFDVKNDRAKFDDKLQAPTESAISDLENRPIE
jgi:hypothetical protein